MDIKLKNSVFELIIKGEEIVGAKQDRIVNSGISIAGKTRVLIPVSCEEQGRWDSESEEVAVGK